MRKLPAWSTNRGAKIRLPSLGNRYPRVTNSMLIATDRDVKQQTCYIIVTVSLAPEVTSYIHTGS